jgi:DNA-binding XRE family transcriptional regulator
MKSSAILSLTTEREIKKLASNIRIARKRRSISISEMAKRLNVSRQTIYRLEDGNLNVSLGLYLETLNQLNLLKGLSVATDPNLDIEAIELEVTRARKKKRVKASIAKDINLNFYIKKEEQKLL